MNAQTVLTRQYAITVAVSEAMPAMTCHRQAEPLPLWIGHFTTFYSGAAGDGVGQRSWRGNSPGGREGVQMLA